MKITATIRGITVNHKGYREHWKVENRFWNMVFCSVKMFLKCFFKVKTSPERLIENSLKSK